MVVHISEELINGAKEANDLTALWNSVATLPGTQSAHFVVPQRNEYIAYKPYSSAPNDLQKIHQLQAVTSTKRQEASAMGTDTTEVNLYKRSSLKESRTSNQGDGQQTIDNDDTHQLTGHGNGDDRESNF